MDLSIRRIGVVAALAALCLLGASGIASAQTSVTVGQAFTVSANHDGVGTTSYQVAVTGPQPYTATLPVSALTGGTISFAIPARSTVGSYTVTVSAIGPGGTGSSGPVGFTVVAALAVPPTRPAGVRIIIQ